MWVMGGGGAGNESPSLGSPSTVAQGRGLGSFPGLPPTCSVAPYNKKRTKNHGLYGLLLRGGRISVEDPRPYISQQSADPPGVGEL